MDRYSLRIQLARKLGGVLTPRDVRNLRRGKRYYVVRFIIPKERVEVVKITARRADDYYVSFTHKNRVSLYKSSRQAEKNTRHKPVVNIFGIIHENNIDHGW